MTVPQRAAAPWYREPWPWLLMAGPAAVVVAGIATIWIAIVSSDGLVVDDYYKQGLAINQAIQRDVLAAQRGYQATVTVRAGAREIVVLLAALPDSRLPETMYLRITHPTRAGMDALVLLRRNGTGAFAGVLPALGKGRRILLLEDTQSTWRLTADAEFPSHEAVILKPANLQQGR